MAEPAPSRMIPPILRHLRRRGVDVDALGRRLGLPADAVDAEAVALSPAAFEALMAAGARAVGDPLLALHLPDALTTPGVAVSELAVGSSATVRASFHGAARYAPLFYAHLVLTCEDTVDGLEVRYRVRDGASSAPGASPHGARFALGSSLSHARRRTDAPLHAARVWFAHPAPAASDPVHAGVAAFFGTDDVRWGAPDDGYALTAADVDRPNRTADPRLLHTASQWADAALAAVPAPDDLVGRLRALLRDSPDPSTVSLAAAARRLGRSSRSLQRHLTAEGTTWRGVVDSVRHDAVAELLRTTALPVAEIAVRTGFADAATLSRAFRRWTGTSPAAWRAGQVGR
ncbi:MAG: AraC family transcriptional regulator ligand-binding domain-containing protein, partial [Alphaproteobacteria bacterium]|nr:AraC family transcriptional regulator ligand-binding domain-containing protein [Alphaproteobacteria bacterium]